MWDNLLRPLPARCRHGHRKPPGLGPVAGIAMILPITYALDPIPGLIMMAGIYYGAMYGGSTKHTDQYSRRNVIETCIDG
jgi:hypothetical protein